MVSIYTADEALIWLAVLQVYQRHLSFVGSLVILVILFYSILLEMKLKTCWQIYNHTGEKPVMFAGFTGENP